jgi:hypothetical protein
MCVLIKDLRRSGMHVCANKGLSKNQVRGLGLALVPAGLRSAHTLGAEGALLAAPLPQILNWKLPPGPGGTCNLPLK